MRHDTAFILLLASVVAGNGGGAPTGYPWLTQLLARRPFKVVAVALANKMARVAGASRPLSRMLEVDIRQRLPGVIPHDEARIRFFDGPRWWEAANRGWRRNYSAPTINA